MYIAIYTVWFNCGSFYTVFTVMKGDKMQFLIYIWSADSCVAYLVIGIQWYMHRSVFRWTLTFIKNAFLY